MSEDQSRRLRYLLGTVGITLADAHEREDAEVRARQRSAPLEPDRARIRELLVARNAPPRDLEWLTSSCPSVELAEQYRAPSDPGDRPDVAARHAADRSDP